MFTLSAYCNYSQRQATKDHQKSTGRREANRKGTKSNRKLSTGVFRGCSSSQVVKGLFGNRHSRVADDLCTHPVYAIIVLVDAGDLKFDVDTSSDFVAREHAVHQIPRGTLRGVPQGVVLVETAKVPLQGVVGSTDGSDVAGEGAAQV